MERLALPSYQHWQDLVRSEHYVLYLRIQYSYDIFFNQCMYMIVLPFSHSCSTRSGGDSTQCHSSHCIMECPGHPRLLHQPLHCALQSSGVSASQETGWNNEHSVSIHCHVWCDCWSKLNNHLPIPSLCNCHSQWYTIGGGDKYSFYLYHCW